MKRINKRLLKTILTNRKIKWYCNYYIEFKSGENGFEYYNFEERINVIGKLFFIVTFIPMVLYSIIMNCVPETFNIVKDCGSEFNYSRIDKINTYQIKILKKLIESEI